MSSRRRIVVVTPRHISDNPRVVKEADALAAGGFDVDVVFAQRAAGTARSIDNELLAHKPWRFNAVRSARTTGEVSSWLLGACKQRLSQLPPSQCWNYSLLAERSTGRTFPMLVQAAIRIKAHLYIGHYAEGLAAAGIAAARTGALLGFDAEDFHTGECNGAAELKRTDFIQRRYLPRCEWVSAASSGIAEALADRYGIRQPVTIHNSFPLADRGYLDGFRRDRQSDSFSVYWYSQAIGLDRGIQDAIRAAGRLKGPIEIHLRGRLDPRVREALERTAREVGVEGQLFFHPTVSPSELLSRAAEHDVGLALEQPNTRNHTLAATNKLFMYLLAGVAVAATDLPGQRSVLGNHPDAARLYPPGDENKLAAILEHWRSDRGALLHAKMAALDCARRRWNWEHESQELVERVSAVLLRRAETPSGKAEVGVLHA